MKDTQRFRLLGWCIIAATVFASICLNGGCSFFSSLPDTVTSAATATPSVNAILPSVTSVSSPNPVLTTSVPSLLHTPALLTDTPYATLTADERQGFVRDMLETNGGCELPCWWGIVPNQTDWQVVKNRFIAVGGFVFEMPHSERHFDYYVSLSFEHSDEVVESITVMSEVARGYTSENFIQDWNRYLLNQMLMRYGEPSQVRIHFLPAMEPGALPKYGLTLAYDALGFTIHYEGPAAYQPPVMRACPLKEVTFIVLKLQSPQPDKPILESPEDPSRPLEETTGMDVGTFYEEFRNADNNLCLETPADIWP